MNLQKNRKSVAIENDLRFMGQVCWAGVVLEFAGLFFHHPILFFLGMGVWIGAFAKQLWLARQLYNARKEEQQEDFEETEQEEEN